MLTLWMVVVLWAEGFRQGKAEWFTTPEQACTYAKGNMGSVFKIRARKTDSFLEVVAVVPVEREITVRARIR